MTQKFIVTFKWGKTVPNPNNITSNGYDFIEEHYTYTVTVTDREEERPYFKRGEAIRKACRKARKETGLNFTIPSSLVSCEPLR